MADTPTDDRLIWKRPSGCTCGVELQGPGQAHVADEFQLVRLIDPACPFHGHAAGRIEAAVGAALRVVRTTPGLPAVDEATIRRVLIAIYPILTGAGIMRPGEPIPTPEPR